MSLAKFRSWCAYYAVDPFVALENENLRKALRAKDDAKVIEILKKEF